MEASTALCPLQADAVSDTFMIAQIAESMRCTSCLRALWSSLSVLIYLIYLIYLDWLQTLCVTCCAVMLDDYKTVLACCTACACLSIPANAGKPAHLGIKAGQNRGNSCATKGAQ